MTEIIPAVLPKNYEEMKNHIALVRGVVPMVQIDICDGLFVPSLTWPFLNKGGEADFLENSFDEHFRRILNEDEGMPFWEEIDFELDLMVLNAVENFDVYTKLGPKRIIFHLDAVGDAETFANFLEGIDMYIRDSMEIGVAVSLDSPIENISLVVPHVDFVQCMGIRKVGYQGEPFAREVLDLIKNLKEKFPDLIISVDGGVDMDSAQELVAVGVSRLVSGSAIFNTDDIISKVEWFREL